MPINQHINTQNHVLVGEGSTVHVGNICTKKLYKINTVWLIIILLFSHAIFPANKGSNEYQERHEFFSE